MPLSPQQNLDAFAGQLPPLRSLRPWLLAVLLLSSVCTLSAYGVAELAPPPLPQRTEIRNALPAPGLAFTVANSPLWQDTLLRRGDTLGSALHRIGSNEPSLLRFVRTNDHARDLLELQPGRMLKAKISAQGELLAITYLHSSGCRISIEKNGQHWESTIEKPLPLISQQIINGLIQEDFLAGFAALALEPETLRQLDEIRQLHGREDVFQTGRPFTLILENASVDGEKVRAPRLLAARFHGLSKSLELFRHTDGGDDGFYFADGRAALPAFLAVPVDNAEISSSFAMRRHPILGVWLQHKGTDFAAPSGSNIYSAAKGTVLRTGTDSGYGNFVEITHANGMSTLYGHMQGLVAGLKAGQTIRQGDLIGYVGSTGRSTGPHLHYEIRRDGVALNPEAITLPTQPPLSGLALEAFKQNNSRYTAQLQMSSQPVQAVRTAMNHFD